MRQGISKACEFAILDTSNPTEFPTANYISVTAFKRAGKTILYLADLARGLLVLVFPTARIKTERIV
jgi:hypothetical protein